MYYSTLTQSCARSPQYSQLSSGWAPPPARPSQMTPTIHLTAAAATADTQRRSDTDTARMGGNTPTKQQRSARRTAVGAVAPTQQSTWYHSSRLRGSAGSSCSWLVLVWYWFQEQGSGPQTSPPPASRRWFRIPVFSPGVTRAGIEVYIDGGR